MVNLDYTILVQMANFLLMIFVLNKLLYKPILGILNRRREQFDKSEEEVTRLNQDVEQKLAEYEQRVRQAKIDAMEQRNALIKEGADLAKGIIDSVRGEIPAMIEQFNARLGAEADAARTILRNQSQKLSLEIAEKSLGRSIQ